MSQKQLADSLKKYEAEISKWLSGTHNLTLKTISKLESVLPINIINPEIIECVTNHYSTQDYSDHVNIKANLPLEKEYISRYGLHIGSYLAAVGSLSVNKDNDVTLVSEKRAA